MSATSYPKPFEEKQSPSGYPVTCKAEKLNYIKPTVGIKSERTSESRTKATHRRDEPSRGSARRQLAGELNRRVVALARRAQPSRQSARRRPEPSCGCARRRAQPSRELARPASST
ncbi:hypothetical protein DY000_02031733 [Brassica cretica]|uniref:Uncharacterized protein n=1 Tax=Brassica cretica TaxID=69181 RepID=A0ABQ7DNV0_BRACR|nr:hypothetical protein DY000_02031733 [Brassica cretica]